MADNHVGWIPSTEELQALRSDVAGAINADLAAQGLTTGHAESTPVNHPRHYNTHPSGIECIEIVRLCSYNMGNTIKYIWRYEGKDGNRDLSKARWSLRDLIASGEAHYPPHRAREKLARAVAADTSPERTVMLYRIMNGQLDEVIATITELIGEADVV